jgi:hypothetical protein
MSNSLFQMSHWQLPVAPTMPAIAGLAYGEWSAEQ